MKSVVELDIHCPREKVAELFADPANSPKWMHDLARCEPVSGSFGTTGSTYRMIPKTGDMVFLATVVARNLPDEVRLRLDGKNVTVSITDRFSITTDGITRLRSVEEFRFTSVIGRLFGFVAQRSIRAAHRFHMESFKEFAERG
jgi:hypothetical protein